MTAYAPIGLRGCIPVTLRAEKLLLLVGYLDDSGKDPQNPITTIAGYAASEAAWATFESEAEPIFQEYIGSEPLHAKDLYHGDKLYAGWRVIEKQAFVAKLCMKLYPLRPLLGVSFSVRKASYATRAAEALKRGLRKRTSTPYTFCLNGILDWLMRDVQVGKMANEEGLALILEEGNEHNEEARISLDAIRKIHGLDQVKSMSFVPKEACRAIQMADLFAFYTRRHNRKIEIEGKEPETDPVLKVLVENLRQRSFVATDFGPEIKASRFFSGKEPS
jgi:hypothetical protein